LGWRRGASFMGIWLPVASVTNPVIPCLTTDDLALFADEQAKEATANEKRKKRICFIPHFEW
jgi:hypothetical protein